MPFIKEDGLENVIVIWDRCFIRVVVHAKLVLVVGTVEGHFDLLHIFRVGVRVVHRSVTRRLSILSFLLVLGEGYLVLLLLVLGLGAELGIETCLVIFLEILGVGVGDGDVVEEPSAT